MKRCLVRAPGVGRTGVNLNVMRWGPDSAAISEGDFPQDSPAGVP